MTELTETTFEAELRSSSTPMLVDFYAAWCGPCKLLAPLLEHAAAHFDGRLRICKVNVETSPGLALQFHISSVPTLKLFRDGRPVDTVVGFIAPQALAQWIRESAAQPAQPLTVTCA